MTYSTWIDTLGNWNPQLLRELRGRLKFRSLVAAIALSLIFQGLVLLVADNLASSETWLEIWRSLCWIISYLLLSIGSYYLVSNLVQEEKSGTLNFIRLSPRPAWQILLGKLLGVSILPLIAIGCMIPLHTIAGFLGGVPYGLGVSYYLILGVSCFWCWSLGMLFGFFGSRRSGLAGQANSLAIAYTALVFFVLAPAFMAWNINVTWKPLLPNTEILGSYTPNITWVWVSISQNFWISHGFTLVNLGVCIAIAWRVLLRRFHQPGGTLLSKRQSYGIAAYLLFLSLGFTLNSDILNPDRSISDYDWFTGVFESAFGVLVIFALVLCLVLMAGLCPQRQALVEWSRQPQHTLQSYLWADKSPAIVSLAVLLVIVNLILIPWIILFSNGAGVEGNSILNHLVLLLGGSSTVFLLGTFMQLIFSLPLRYPSIWYSVLLLLWVIVPPMVLRIIHLIPQRSALNSLIWAFFGYPVGQFEQMSQLPFVLGGILFQWGISMVLLLQLKQSIGGLRKIGQSVSPLTSEAP